MKSDQHSIHSANRFIPRSAARDGVQEYAVPWNRCPGMSASSSTHCLPARFSTLSGIRKAVHLMNRTHLDNHRLLLGLRDGVVDGLLVLGLGVCVRWGPERMCIGKYSEPTSRDSLAAIRQSCFTPLCLRRRGRHRLEARTKEARFAHRHVRQTSCSSGPRSVIRPRSYAAGEVGQQMR